MSIFPAYIDELKTEDARQPIDGDVLLIGRQTVEDSALSDIELFRQFPSVETVRALDVSDYEGAEIIHDLNAALPADLSGICDFMFDGSCLDNIFDPAQALRSMSEMLRPGGRMVLAEHGTAIQGAVLAFSPEWFFDFFAANDYVRCKIVLFGFHKGGMSLGHWARIPWNAYLDDGTPASATPGIEIGDFMNFVIAEKGSRSTDHRAAVQGQYRGLHGADDSRYREAFARFSAEGAHR